jgi:hypothetical protein
MRTSISRARSASKRFEAETSTNWTAVASPKIAAARARPKSMSKPAEGAIRPDEPEARQLVIDPDADDAARADLVQRASASRRGRG